jgi:hypothetical protein
MTCNNPDCKYNQENVQNNIKFFEAQQGNWKEQIDRLKKLDKSFIKLHGVYIEISGDNFDYAKISHTLYACPKCGNVQIQIE